MLRNEYAKDLAMTSLLLIAMLWVHFQNAQPFQQSDSIDT